MKILLVGINAKFIHTCPAIYCLHAYARTHGEALPDMELLEYTINDRYEDVRMGLVESQAQVIAFSTYIWNVDRVLRLLRDLKRIFGEEVSLWAGGPEAGNSPSLFLQNGADLCMCGEGEKSFTYLASLAGREEGFPAGEALWESLSGRRGYAFLREGELCHTGLGEGVDLDEIPFLYGDLTGFDHRILYYESSRGCPFGCAYCLSGKERGVRFRSMEKVKRELSFFLERRVPQVKFIDRTFNADPQRALAIWSFLKEADNGYTNFHFEIEAGRMTGEELALLKTLRPGLLQMEIGVQSANERTLRSVYRSPDLEPVRRLMRELVPLQNINLHLDLIAGLPYEDLESFRRSFCQVYALSPHQYQLGFLKLLPGTALYEQQEEYALVASQDAPREILKTRWLSARELNLLHRISDAVEIYVNSQGFRHTLPLVEELFEDAFALFEALSEYLRREGYEGNSPSLQNRYNLLEGFIREHYEALGGQQGQQERRVQERAKEGRESLGEEILGPGPHCLEEILEVLRFDRCLHVHGSRRMQAEETFDFGEGEVRYHFDYGEASPVNGEARFWVVEQGRRD